MIFFQVNKIIELYYTNIKNYNKLFTCLNDKKEVIDYLFSKTRAELLKLTTN